MAENVLKTFIAGEKITADDTNSNNRYLQNLNTATAQELQAYLEQEIERLDDDLNDKADTDLSNVTTISNSSVVKTALDNKSDIVSTFGYNQTLQNVKSQRASGATYTNTTGKPIIVMVSDTRQDNVWHTTSVYVGGVQIGYSDGYGHNSTAGMCTFIVPSGSTYRVNADAISFWFEYR